MTRQGSFAVALSTLLTTAAIPQAGTLDPSFGINGVATLAYGEGNSAGAMAVLPDDAILMAGVNYSPEFFPEAVVLVKWTVDGLPFTGFGDGGVALRSFAPEMADVCGMAVLDDGRILVGGRITPAGTWQPRAGFVARFHADGSIDDAFGDNGVAEFALDGWVTQADAMALQADGRILFTGHVYGANIYNLFVARLNADGTLDTTFDDDGIRTIHLGGHNSGGDAVVQLPDGRIVVAGWTSVPLGGFGMVMAALTSTGLNDPSFGDAGLVQVEGMSASRGISVQEDGGITVGARVEGHMGAVRFTATGGLDPAFGDGGWATAPLQDPAYYTEAVNDIVAASDGGFVLVGEAHDETEWGHVMLARITADGTPDPAFGEQGVTVDGDQVRKEGIVGAFQSDGRLVVACSHSGYELAVARYIASTVGIGELQGAVASASVFPNPVADRFTLSFEAASTDVLSIDLIDMQGRIVHRFAQHAFAAGMHRLDLAWPADAVAGAYTIAIASAQGNAFVKVLR